jgi:hypothetical protein
MTTNVPKGANRGAAEAKRRKHDQRTPLPPRPGAVEGAREAIAEAKGLLTQTKYPSVEKAEAYVAAAKALGWETILWSEGDHSKVLTKRGTESIQIEWLKGVFVPETCTYRAGSGIAVRLRNASAAKAKMGVSVSEASVAAEKATRVRSAGPGPRRASTGRRASILPEGWELMLDADVVEATRGKKILWVNRVSGLEEEDFVRDVITVRSRGPEGGPAGGLKAMLPSLAAPRIEDGPSGRVLHFLGAFGFRCVLVSQITRVGR